MSSHRTCLAAIAAAFLFSSIALAQGPIPGSIPKGPQRVELTPVATGLVAPNTFLTAPDGTGRHFIVDQPGQIRILQNGSLLGTPFLDISATAAVLGDRRVIALNAGYDERGLLGMAFDPNFTNPASPGFRRIFTYTSEATTGGTADYTQVNGTPNHHSVVTAWRVDPNNPNRIDTSSRQELLRFDQPQSNHNGGAIAFGPDGFLYIASGDGGQANDKATGHIEPTGNGQDNNTPLGKMLRIDVYGNNANNGKFGIPAGNPFAAAGGIKEIYATGFRNPFRFSFDGNDLYVADVGQNTLEEVSKVEVGKNYGWRYKEGSFFFNPDAANTVSATPINGVTPGTPGAPVAVMPDVVDPIIEYDRDDNGAVKRISIIGGYVYRGSALDPALQGKYVFGDFSSAFNLANGSIYYADILSGDINQFIIGNDDRNLGLFVKGMGQDVSGELYVLVSTNLGPSGATGQVLKLIPVPEPAMGLPMAIIALVLRRRRYRYFFSMASVFHPR